jgi:hypothetical protein
VGFSIICGVLVRFQHTALKNKKEVIKMNIYSVRILGYHKKNGTQVLANSPQEAIEKVKQIKNISAEEKVLSCWKKIL